MVYLIGWFGMFLSALLLNSRSGKALVYSVLFYCLFIALFRGAVGTDTANYIKIFNAFSNGYELSVGDEGFKYLIKLLNNLFNNSQFAVNSVSIIYFALLAAFFYRSNKNEAFFLVSYFLPVFAYSYSMNGLRVGLAVAVFLIAIQTYSNKKSLLVSFKYFLLGFFLHITTVFLPVMFFLYQVKWLSIRFLIRFLLVFSFVFIVFLLNFDYVSGKYLAYSDGNSVAPSIYSGLSVVFSLFIIIFFMLFGKLPRHDKKWIFTISFVLIVMSFILAKYTYAGIRILDLLATLVPIVVLLRYNEKGINFDKHIKLAFFMSGAFVALNSFIGYLSYYGVGGSPFLPYYFIFKG